MNGKTIKQLADELKVSKPTVTKVIEMCGLSESLIRVGNRYELTEKQAQLVKSQIEKSKKNKKSQNNESPKTQNSQKSQNNEPPKTQKSQNNELLKTQNSIISLLQKQLDLLQQQLTIKDKQLAAKDKQISDLTEALLSAQKQQNDLIDVLTAAQALHAGTIQERLTAQTNSSEVTAKKPQQEKKGFFARIFEIKDRKKTI